MLKPATLCTAIALGLSGCSDQPAPTAEPASALV